MTDAVTDADLRALRSLVGGLVRAAHGADGFADGAPVDVAPPPTVSAALAAAIRRHLLAPLAHRAGWPGFRGDHAAAAIQADRRGAALAEAVGALGGAGIDVILLKGVAYAGTIYPDPALRPMSDIDLLVPADRYRDAIDAIGRLGYWHAGTPDQLSAPNHGFSLKRKDGSIDVHRHITHAGRTSIDLAAVWRDARPAHVPGARRASPAHEYLLHVAHMARHELAVPAISFVDAALLREDAHRASTCDLDDLARTWRLARGNAAVLATLRAVGDGTIERSGFLPSLDEILSGARSGRVRQVTRKLALTDDLRGIGALLTAAVRGHLEHRRSRR